MTPPNTPTPEEAAERLKLRGQLDVIFTELEANLKDPNALLGYGHAIEQVLNWHCSRTAQEIEVAVIKHLSDISRAVGLLQGLGHPDEYLERHCNQLMAQAEEAQGQLATINEKGME